MTFCIAASAVTARSVGAHAHSGQQVLREYRQQLPLGDALPFVEQQLHEVQDTAGTSGGRGDWRPGMRDGRLQPMNKGGSGEADGSVCAEHAMRQALGDGNDKIEKSRLVRLGWAVGAAVVVSGCEGW